MTPQAHTCPVSGYRLVPFGPSVGYHVGKAKYRQPSAAVRTADVHRQDWGRFDILGETFYVAESVETAYAEVLAAFKLPNGANDPLQEIADMYGVPRATAIEWITEDWALIEENFQALGGIPASWREARRVFEVTMNDNGWLVDIHHPATISALEGPADGPVARFLASQGIPALTLSALTGDNRMITTILADVIRTTELHDESAPRGVQFPSKHGGGWCRAIWRAEDAPTLFLGVIISAEQQIYADDVDLAVVGDRFHITIT
ncbi:hypothetical protein ABTZ44_06435 [Microbacterium oxydans]|uniref:hypothetical protein n=1 Tax=Microbacterium oxydans TaxID=82380 RepID=UPI003319FD44